MYEVKLVRVTRQVRTVLVDAPNEEAARRRAHAILRGAKMHNGEWEGERWWDDTSSTGRAEEVKRYDPK